MYTPHIWLWVFSALSTFFHLSHLLCKLLFHGQLMTKTFIIRKLTVTTQFFLSWYMLFLISREHKLLQQPQDGVLTFWGCCCSKSCCLRCSKFCCCSCSASWWKSELFTDSGTNGLKWNNFNFKKKAYSFSLCLKC